MNKRKSIEEIMPKNKKENSSSHSKKGDFTPHSGAFVDRIMYLQRTIGNKAVERLIRSGTIQANELTSVHQQQSSLTVVGSGVKICYVPLSIFPGWLPTWAAPANHAFIEFDDGWSAGFTMLPGENKKDARIISPEPRQNDSRKWCFNAERKDSEECQEKPINEIKSCIQAETKKSPGKYHLTRNNCGDWVKKTFDNCCLKPKTPWHIY